MFASFSDALTKPRLCARAASALLALSLACGPAQVHAADAEPGEANESSETSESEARVLSLSDEGSALYERGEYRHALEKFIAAFTIGQDPNLLFNMGRCYEQLGEKSAAEEKYRAFITDPGADPAGVERAKALIDSLNAPTPAAADTSALIPVATPQAASPRDAEHQPSRLRAVLPWATLGASVACLTAGTTLYLMGAADHGRITDSRGYDDPNGISPLTEARAHDLVSSGDTKKTLGGVGLGLGGALLATSIVLFVTGQSDAPATLAARDPRLGLTLAPTPSGGSVGLSGSF